MDNQHIKNLVVNLPSDENLGAIDLVLEAGAANGSYEIGCLMYLKELEKQEYIKVDRLSGSSIGSISAILYITNQLELCTEMFEIMREAYSEYLKTFGRGHEVFLQQFLLPEIFKLIPKNLLIKSISELDFILQKLKFNRANLNKTEIGKIDFEVLKNKL